MLSSLVMCMAGASTMGCLQSCSSIKLCVSTLYNPYFSSSWFYGAKWINRIKALLTMWYSVLVCGSLCLFFLFLSLHPSRYPSLLSSKLMVSLFILLHVFIHMYSHMNMYVLTGADTHMHLNMQSHT